MRAQVVLVSLAITFHLPLLELHRVPSLCGRQAGAQQALEASACNAFNPMFVRGLYVQLARRGSPCHQAYVPERQGFFGESWVLRNISPLVP